MREQLKQHHLRRLTFSGTFVRFGTKSGWKGRTEQTILLRDIRDDQGDLLTDHLWFNLTKEFAALDLQLGDEVKFDARVRQYRKGYLGQREDDFVYGKPPSWDYKLSHPTNVRKLTPALVALPLFAGEES